MNMFQYIVRRTLYAIPILLGVCLIIFLIFNVFFGDPTALLLGKHANAQQMSELREQLGLNKPLVMQYIDVVKSAFTFDFGSSWATKQKISHMFANGLGPSLSVSIPGFVISTILAIIIALFVSHFRGKTIDTVVRVSCIAMMSLSSLVYILFCQWFFAYKMNWFEISGYESGFPQFLPYITLPVLIWVAISVGPDVRFFRTVMLDEIYQDYVRTAKAKGLGDLSILFKHVLKNAMVPLITYIVIQLPFLILGALLIETFFSIPGLGTMIITALNNYDFPVIKAIAVVTSVGIIFFQLVTDILYTVFDPRVKIK